MAISWDEVVAFATSLPEVELSSSWGTPSLKVRGKLMGRLRTEAEGGLALPCSPDDKAALVESDDPAFYTTAHYDGYDYVLVDLDKVDPDELREIVTEAWRRKAPVRLRKAFDG